MRMSSFCTDGSDPVHKPSTVHSMLNTRESSPRVFLFPSDTSIRLIHVEKMLVQTFSLQASRSV